MKRFSIAGLSAIALIAGVTFSNQIPVVANIFESGVAIAEVAEKGQVELRLKAARKIVRKDAQGKKKITWEALQNGATVEPGELLRYSINGVNNGDTAVKNLRINQPIPQGMTYVLNSATVNANAGAEITYSIDGGKTYVLNPTVAVTLKDGTVETRPAPDTAYTNVSWNFGESVPGQGEVDGTYQVRVR